VNPTLLLQDSSLPFFLLLPPFAHAPTLMRCNIEEERHNAVKLALKVLLERH
jgi:hypothetical protein